MDAVEWAISLDLKKIVLESDYQPLITTILGKDTAIPWELRGIAEDIQDLLGFFDNWYCKHTHRLANKCADELAKYARKEGVSGCWLNQLPEFLESFIMSDIESILI